MSINQLRGRSFRLDKNNPNKVANNWDIVCLAEDLVKDLMITIDSRGSTLDCMEFVMMVLSKESDMYMLHLLKFVQKESLKH